GYVRRQESNQVPFLLGVEAAGVADELEDAVIRIQPEPQPTDRLSLFSLVPAVAAHHAIGRAQMLDLGHRTLAWLVGPIGGLRDHAVEAGAFEAVEPLPRGLGIVRA